MSVNGSGGIDASPQGPRNAREAFALAALLVVTAAILRFMGQPWWCAVGDPALWTSAVGSTHTSQHLADPYTFTHFLHGLGFYAILWALASNLPLRTRFTVAMIAESVWELFENTDFVINRYREATISLDYFGDSIANSVGDILACAAGFVAATALPTAASIGVFAGVELLLVLWIRDSLILNIVMLLWPIETIKTWQGG